MESRQHTSINGQATVDLDREARQGFPEVIYGEKKTPEITAEIAKWRRVIEQ